MWLNLNKFSSVTGYSATSLCLETSKLALVGAFSRPAALSSLLLSELTLAQSVRERRRSSSSCSLQTPTFRDLLYLCCPPSAFVEPSRGSKQGLKPLGAEGSRSCRHRDFRHVWCYSRRRVVCRPTDDVIIFGAHPCRGVPRAYQSRADCLARSEVSACAAPVDAGPCFLVF